MSYISVIPKMKWECCCFRLKKEQFKPCTIQEEIKVEYCEMKVEIILWSWSRITHLLTERSRLVNAKLTQMSLSMMLEVLSLRARKTSSKTKSFSYRNDHKNSHHNLTQFSSHHLVSHACHRPVWCDRVWLLDFCWLCFRVSWLPLCSIHVIFSCVAWCLSIVMKLNISLCSPWQSFYFSFLFSTFLKPCTFYRWENSSPDYLIIY